MSEPAANGNKTAKTIAQYWIPRVVCWVGWVTVTAFLLCVLLGVCPFCVPWTGFTRFVAISYLVLIVGLIMVWVCEVPNDIQGNIDSDAFLQNRLKATIAILVMTTLLGIASLMAHVAMKPEPGQTPPKQEVKSQDSSDMSGVVVNCSTCATPLCAGGKDTSTRP